MQLVAYGAQVGNFFQQDDFHYYNLTLSCVSLTGIATVPAQPSTEIDPGIH